MYGYHKFFTDKTSWQAEKQGNSFLISAESVSKDAENLVDELNSYLKKNEGTTDFNIIKDKVERKFDMMYEDAVAYVSFPTYFGLMGTFLGVFLGLMKFKEGVAEFGMSDKMVSELIGGIYISMITSLGGLICMIIGNWVANYSQKKVEPQKSRFYEFIQVDLMPVLGTSMVSALNKLHSTINTFEPAFRGVIDEFKGAFRDCTETLRGSFGENVLHLTHAVDVMGSNMSLINENVRKQDELLKTMRQNETLETLERFNEAAGNFNSITVSIGKLVELNDGIVMSSERLIRAQNDFVSQMAVPERVFDKVNSILDRITVFEESINALGKEISNTQLLGNTQMNLIEEQLKAIRRKTDLAVSYQEISQEELWKVYEVQTKAINELNVRYRAEIQRHGEDFREAMDEFIKGYTVIINDCRRTVEDKRNEYIDEIRRSLDLEAGNRHLAQLDRLEGMCESVEAIRKSVKEQPELMAKVRGLQDEVANMSKAINDIRTDEIPKAQSLQTSDKPVKNGFWGRFSKKK
ncbi:MAG: hypothetical protein NC308_03180 [Clostridium sp.]|nr:hypothetical protein [Bacteroides sp.]MCM1197868.1 hypothetical protein [Clostridium sp.]